ncbi:histamine N-methyltransferase-like isoform X2 [Acanthaster planci]|uniref:Histamine N-methyltransferase-like isoform X2 n=1 Tax=Acanthaster planci TaxID=133434 RepID=A0A8B7YRB5_ACAPL|nr:histamine N-methyltransferase-like isoform X2 [Acanthaster planci]
MRGTVPVSLYLFVFASCTQHDKNTCAVAYGYLQDDCIVRGSANSVGEGIASSLGVCSRDRQPPEDGTNTGPHVGDVTGGEEQQYPWLYDDATRYMECLDEFQRFSDEWEGVEGWIKEHLVELIEAQDQRAFHDAALVTPATIDCVLPGPLQEDDQVYWMLGVGSGSGEVDLAILRALLPHHLRVSTTVIEPDPSQIGLYRELMADSELSGATFEFHQQTSSEFMMENSGNNKTFDLIHMVHVLYHIEKRDLEETLSHYYKSLSPGGMMIIAYESDKSSLARIRKVLQPFKRGTPPYMSIGDIEKALLKVTPTFQRTNIPGTLEVTACLTGDSSASGERLWDFITRVVNFRANAPKESVRRAAEMLREFSWQLDGSDRFLTNCDTAVLVVAKRDVPPTECQ